MDEAEAHRGSGLGSSRECDAEEHVSRERDQTNRESKNGKGFKGPGRENIKNYGQQVIGSRAQEHVAGCRREKTPGVGIAHHPGWERPVHWEG